MNFIISNYLSIVGFRTNESLLLSITRPSVPMFFNLSFNEIYLMKVGDEVKENVLTSGKIF